MFRKLCCLAPRIRMLFTWVGKPGAYAVPSAKALIILKKTFELPVCRFARMIRLFVFFPHRLLAIALILLMQGPAMLVQEVAWVNMLVSYTQERGLKRGIIETFNGDHPCPLCKKAEQLRQQERPHDPAEKQMPTQAPRLSWTEMVVNEWPYIPVITGHDIAATVSTCIAYNLGIGTDAPDSPPPEVGSIC